MRAPLLLPIVSTILIGCTVDPEVEFSGAYLYSNYCASCHGANGEGDGPVAAVMATQVPNLRLLSERNSGIFPVDAVTEYVDGRTVVSAHGDRRMPVWGDVFSWEGTDDPGIERRVEERIGAIVDFVSEMQY